jgi:hypothetical protein
MLRCRPTTLGPSKSAAPLCFCQSRSRPPRLLIAISAVMCARRCQSPGSAPSLPTPLPTTSLTAAVGVVLALPSILTLYVAPFPFDPPWCRSCSFLLRLCTHSFVSSRSTFLSVTLYLGTPCRCMGSVLVLIARFASLGHRRILLGGTPWWNADGAASSISFSAARLPCLIARILLICGLIFWISCLVTLSRPRGCARHCMLTLETLRMSAAFACRGFPFCFLSACPRSVCATV